MKYLNPDKVKQLDHPQGTVKVRVYDRLIFKVAPNPHNKKLADEIHKQYEQGHMVAYWEYKLKESDFNDPKNWNS